MTIKNIVLIGAGGFAREVLDICETCNIEKPSFDFLGYIVDPQYGKPGTIINGKPILGDFSWLEENHNHVYVTCAVGAPYQRYRLIQRASELGCRYFTLIHPNVQLTRWVNIGEGSIIAAGSILTNQIQIGNHVHINLACTIGHNVILQDFVSLAPAVHLSGNVTLKEGCYIGTGVNIIEKVCVDEWSIVGAGSTIIGDIPANSTVVGLPGKVIKQRNPGWHVSD